MAQDPRHTVARCTVKMVRRTVCGGGAIQPRHTVARYINDASVAWSMPTRSMPTH
jgi:hypothetical protein